MSNKKTSRPTASVPKVLQDGKWRHDNVGRLLNAAVRHFEARVLSLLIEAGQDQCTLSHINATRHLDLEGTRLTEMARRAAMTKQSMSELVLQLKALGLVAHKPDPLDGRARIVYFTETGLVWLAAFRKAVLQAEKEMSADIGPEAFGALKTALQQYRSTPWHAVVQDAGEAVSGN